VWQCNSRGEAEFNLPMTTTDAEFTLTGDASACLEVVKGGEQMHPLMPGISINPQCLESGEVAIIQAKQGEKKGKSSVAVHFSGPVWLYQVKVFQQGSSAKKFSNIGTAEEGWEDYSGEAFTST
ncbi:unnamed protein product, partial [Amoebophrya sp. A25]